MDVFPGYPGLRPSAEQLLDDVATLPGLSTGQVVDGFRNALQRPAVIAVTGRVDADKSTLVNSLISGTWASTSAQETTVRICCYAYGAPARAEAVSGSGEAVPLPGLSLKISGRRLLIAYGSTCRPPPVRVQVAVPPH